jgi:hypothetical protein
MTPANRAALDAMHAAGRIAYVENERRDGNITVHIASADGLPVCGARFTELGGPYETIVNRSCGRCSRLRPDAFP